MEATGDIKLQIMVVASTSCKRKPPFMLNSRVLPPFDWDSSVRLAKQIQTFSSLREMIQFQVAIMNVMNTYSGYTL